MACNCWRTPQTSPSLWEGVSQKDCGGSFFRTWSHRELEREIKVTYKKMYFLYTPKFVACDSHTLAPCIANKSQRLSNFSLKQSNVSCLSLQHPLRPQQPPEWPSLNVPLIISFPNWKPSGPLHAHSIKSKGLSGVVCDLHPSPISPGSFLSTFSLLCSSVDLSPSHAVSGSITFTHAVPSGDILLPQFLVTWTISTQP